MNGNRNSGNDFFYELLDNPAGLSHSNAFNLQLLINDFPQSGLLRSMLAVKREEESLKSASAYVNPKLLYRIATGLASLPAVSEEQIVLRQKPHEGNSVFTQQDNVELPNLTVDETNYFHVPFDPDMVYIPDENQGQTAVPVEVDEDVQPDEDNEARYEDATLYAEESIADVTHELEEEDAVSLSVDSDAGSGNEAIPFAVSAQIADITPDETPDKEEVEYGGAEEVAEEQPAVEKTPELETANNVIGAKPVKADQEIDDEVFEEIVSIEDIGLEQLAIMNRATDEDGAEKDAEGSAGNADEIPDGDSYFVFEPALPEDDKHYSPAKISAQNAAGNTERRHVSRYNDEKMPYSFMWWLDKTRKEHASIYQPFAAEGKFHVEAVKPAEKPQPAADHLQQQYVENIFAVTAVVSELNVTPPKVVAPPVETKVDKIIEKFITQEPQIKHPSKIKLDNENKAKKSSEDRDELVTETLAKIYTEQMLYHKAILTYKKLMLKFPEKSLYFAGQIEQLENKIN